MKADIRKGIGCVYVVISAENDSERTMLDIVAEKRNWTIESKVSAPVRGGVLHMQEITLAPRPGEQ